MILLDERDIELNVKTFKNLSKTKYEGTTFKIIVNNVRGKFISEIVKVYYNEYKNMYGIRYVTLNNVTITELMLLCKGKLYFDDGFTVKDRAKLRRYE